PRLVSALPSRAAAGREGGVARILAKQPPPPPLRRPVRPPRRWHLRRANPRISVPTRPDSEQGDGTRGGLAGRRAPRRDPRRPLAPPRDGRHAVCRSGAGSVAQPTGLGELLAKRTSERPCYGATSPSASRLVDHP